MAGVPSGWAGDALRLRFAPEKDYGPFIYETHEGQVEGLSADFLNAMAAQGELQIDTLPAQPLAAILEAARQGQVDLISSLRPTPERAEFLGFTRPYVTVPAVLVTLPSRDPQSLGDFRGRPVAVGRGYAVESFVREKYPEVQWTPVDDDSEGLRLLRAGHVGAVVADVASVHFAADRLGLRSVQVNAAIGFEYPLSFAFPKSRPDIGRALEDSLRQLPEPRRQTLRQHWLDGRQQSGDDPRAVWLRRIGLGLAGVAVLGLVVTLVRRSPDDDAL
ncbi:MAG: transporter substrate-binding domain-containing protein [Curvibacter lanceolatus]|uniref:transporter substrate-binding domain-containing protein n=1 Tax=Curvibacter lanceolatus TaxID=86182 RepID=UPI00146C38EA|nr:transporter substrate-binding domain-containing protein [Curvibacter lanceolatus]MBV5293984.1 transporter substrate-binding domain-containing protein [Curvibacter lanceolatus]